MLEFFLDTIFGREYMSVLYSYISMLHKHVYIWQKFVYLCVFMFVSQCMYMCVGVCVYVRMTACVYDLHTWSHTDINPSGNNLIKVFKSILSEKK